MRPAGHRGAAPARSSALCSRLLRELWQTGLEAAATAVEVIAAILLVAGAARFVWHVVPNLWAARRSGRQSFRSARVMLGGYILAALEFLIVADILFTILRRTLEELYILGLLTAIRTALSWFLTRELEELRSDPGEAPTP